MKPRLLSWIVIGGLAASMSFAAESIQIKGSDTLVNMVQKLAEAYMQQNADASLSVTGGGSGTGIAALLNRETDIADASRKIKGKELKKARQKGIDVRELTIAIDALSVIIHKDNPLKSLSVEEIGAIFRGDIKNWKVVGGPDRPITLYGRQSNSGTYSFFRKAVLKGDYSAHMNRMNGNSQIVESVKRDKSGIGYVGVGYVVKNGKPISDIGILDIAAKKGGAAYGPLDKAAVGNGKYPIARGLNQYTQGAPKGLMRQFIAFELSEKGQSIVAEMGFYPIGSEMKKSNQMTMQ